MLPKRLIEGFDRVRLRNFLALFFLALAIPTAVLIWQAYSQLKWEAFHQYQGDAEELTQRIDARLNALIKTADAHSFADYTFLVVSGDPSANLVQRSPLSAYPVPADLPGVLGYFQVNTDGEFTTPLLPPEGTEATSLGISSDEYSDRLSLARELQSVLSDNRLVQSRGKEGLRRARQSSLDAPSTVLEEEKEADLAGEMLSSMSDDKDAVDRLDLAAAQRQVVRDENYSQLVFDELNQPRRSSE
ncbi:MAG: histidine kinase, partial [Woeseiaceae bacterium]|nr:histidine kinase [Woeseiaceae bacterium]